MSTYNPISGRVGQYLHDGNLFSRMAAGKTYTVGFSTAYAAMGLIGSEINGIFVLNEDDFEVVLDQHLRVDSGWFGPQKQHFDELARLKALSDKDFLAWVRQHPRARYRYRKA